MTQANIHYLIGWAGAVGVAFAVVWWLRGRRGD